MGRIKCQFEIRTVDPGKKLIPHERRKADIPHEGAVLHAEGDTQVFRLGYHHLKELSGTVKALAGIKPNTVKRIRRNTG